MPRQTRNLRSSERYAWQRLPLQLIDDPHGAMRHFRALFGEIDEDSADAPLSRDPAATDANAPTRR
jgi:hypothetical protein